jgi:hypothetical protein
MVCLLWDRQFMKIGQTGRIVSVPKGHTGKVGVQFDERPSRKLEELHRPHALVDWCDCKCGLASALMFSGFRLLWL